MEYAELLKDRRWKLKRGDILLRDQLHCTNCHNERIKEGSVVGILLEATMHHAGRLDLYHGRFATTNVYIISFKANNEGDEYTSYLVLPSQDPITTKSYHEYIVFFVADAGKTPSIQLVEKLGEQIFIKSLHIHHRYYQDGKFPWEYPDTALQTLCWHCHKELHENTKIEWRNDSGKKIGMLTPCLRCLGAGVLPEYTHVQGGICFQCHGAKYQEFIEKQDVGPT